jgi:hypothetical protein
LTLSSRKPSATTKRILELTLWLGLAAGVAAQVPDVVNLPVQSRPPQIDKGYNRAAPYAVAFASRTISFSGREWWVKSSNGLEVEVIIRSFTFVPQPNP